MLCSRASWSGGANTGEFRMESQSVRYRNPFVALAGLVTALASFHAAADMQVSLQPGAAQPGAEVTVYVTIGPHAPFQTPLIYFIVYGTDGSDPALQPPILPPSGFNINLSQTLILQSPVEKLSTLPPAVTGQTGPYRFSVAFKTPDSTPKRRCGWTSTW